jgi:NAD-dependent SIR2 family protein deacetylase
MQMGIYDAIKDAVQVAQKIDNIDLQKQLLALQTQVVDLVEENRTLKATIATRAELTFARNSYWRGDDGPYCSRCWDAKGTLVHMHIQKGAYPRCPNCENYAVNPDELYSPIG